MNMSGGKEMPKGKRWEELTFEEYKEVWREYHLEKKTIMEYYLCDIGEHLSFYFFNEHQLAVVNYKHEQNFFDYCNRRGITTVFRSGAMITYHIPGEKRGIASNSLNITWRERERREIEADKTLLSLGYNPIHGSSNQTSLKNRTRKVKKLATIKQSVDRSLVEVCS